MFIQPRSLTPKNILPAIIMCGSLVFLCQHEQGYGSGSVLISITGLIAVSVYLLKNNFSQFAFWFGIAGLLIIFNQELLQGTEKLLSAANIPDLSQGFTSPVYFHVNIASVKYEAGLNFVAVFLLFFQFSFGKVDLKGKQLSFFPYKHDNSLVSVFPLKRTGLKYVTLSSEPDWLLVKLNKPFQYKSMEIEYALIKRNDKQPIIPNKCNQLVFFKLIPDVNLLDDEDNKNIEFLYEEWVLCK